MKKLALIGIVALMIFGCSNQNKKQQKTDDQPAEVVVVTVDDLYQNAPDMADNEIVVKGTVLHDCKKGGARCLIRVRKEDINIRVDAGKKIGAVLQEQMGS